MRKRIYRIVERAEAHDRLSQLYDVFMMLVIVVSLVPLAFKETHTALVCIDFVTAGIFILDYVLRLVTADLKLKKGWLSFPMFVVTPLAIIDVISIVPTFFVWNSALRVLKVIRLLRSLRVLKFFKSFRYSKNIEILGSVFRKQKKSLSTVCILALGYVLVSALVVYNVEPDTFKNYFEAIYWATVSLTTVGYGDIYPTSEVGRVITMISSILGVAIVALPSGIVTAGYMTEIDKNSTEEKQANEAKTEDCER